MNLPPKGGGVGLKEAARQIKETANIVDVVAEHVNLKRSGRNYIGLCPFHEDRKPSFVVSEERQIFHCFGCGAGGDVIAFYMKFHNLAFGEAVQELARRFGIPLSLEKSEPSSERRTALFELNEKAKRFYEHLLWGAKAGEEARAYLTSRGLSEKTARLFGLGFAPTSFDSLTSHLRLAGADLALAAEAGLLVPREDGSFYDRFRNRLMFPIFDSNHRVAGFGGRILGDGEPKYLNTPETPVYHKGSILYGLAQTKGAIRAAGFGFVVEGYFDLLSLYDKGVKEVVATLGTALTPQQVRLLRGLAAEWYLVFDADEAGLKAALRAAPVFLNANLFPKVVVLPEGEDPDSFVCQAGAGSFYALREQAKDIFDFMLDLLSQRYPATPEGKLALFKELKPAFEALKDQMLLELQLVRVAERLKVSESALRAALKGVAKPVVGRSAPKEARSYSERTLVEFVIHYPEYLSDFLKLGLLRHLRDARLKALVEILSGFKDGCTPADLTLEDLELQALLSEILLSPPPFEEFPPERVAEEIKRWLARQEQKEKLVSLLEAIKEAEASGREEEALRLLRKYQELRCQC